MLAEELARAGNMAPGLGGWVLCLWSKPIKGCNEWLLLCSAGTGTLTERSASGGLATAGEGEPGLGGATEAKPREQGHTWAGQHPAPMYAIEVDSKNFIGDV